MHIMKSFVRAHTDAQELMTKYFCDDRIKSPDDIFSNVRNGQVEVELARCLLQSKTSVHNAVLAALRVYKKNEELFKDIRKVIERKHIVESLEHFVEEALECEAISATNAGSLLHPLHHEE